MDWVADELTKFSAHVGQGGNRAPPFEIVRNANWVGIQLAMSPLFREKKEITELGWETALAHHVPSGKLVLASGKNFADRLLKTVLGKTLHSKRR